MKHIHKNPEPSELISWKQQQQAIGVNCNYESLQNPHKRKVHESLLNEQGYLCCYCCRSIVRNSSNIEHKQDGSHIEHFAAQSKTDDALSVAYHNLHASCGSQEHWPHHCGNYRKNERIPISPLDPDCESYFTYNSNGNIRAVADHPKQQEVQKTIDVLNLNHYDLAKSREELLDTLISLSDAEASELFQFCLKRNSEGKFEPYCAAMADYIQQYFSLS
ncbi:MAG: TIGR02646 family protein [Cyanobacteria bacterium SBLK]|nr:TIGR02646 family protein [Cyanobacteria bacterium SBLK]